MDLCSQGHHRYNVPRSSSRHRCFFQLLLLPTSSAVTPTIKLRPSTMTAWLTKKPSDYRVKMVKSTWLTKQTEMLGQNHLTLDLPFFFLKLHPNWFEFWSLDVNHFSGFHVSSETGMIHSTIKLLPLYWLSMGMRRWLLNLNSVIARTYAQASSSLGKVTIQLLFWFTLQPLFTFSVFCHSWFILLHGAPLSHLLLPIRLYDIW